jgi:hypothetical protein
MKMHVKRALAKGEIFMKTRTLLVILVTFGLLASCVQMKPHPMDMTSIIRNAKTSADHEALAKHYEDAAKEMRLKVEEHKKTLEEYEAHPYYYGKRAQDLKAHCRSLISSYEQASEANMSMAKVHRQMAEETRQNQ